MAMLVVAVLEAMVSVNVRVLVGMAETMMVMVSACTTRMCDFVASKPLEKQVGSERGNQLRDYSERRLCCLRQNDGVVWIHAAWEFRALCG
jgi:hypothetical protein